MYSLLKVGFLICLFGLVAPLNGQSLYLDVAGEIPFPSDIESFKGYDGAISGNLALRATAGNYFAIHLGYQFDGFSRNNENINLAIDELKVHSPYFGVSANILGNKPIIIEPQLNVGYAFLRYLSEDFPTIAGANDTEGIHVMPALNIGFQLPAKLRVFARVTQHYLFKENGNGDFERDSDIQYLNLGGGVSLRLF